MASCGEISADEDTLQDRTMCQQDVDQNKIQDRGRITRNRERATDGIANTETIPKNNDECRVCRKTFRSKDKAVECEICLNWFHKKCEKISDALYEVLNDDSNNCHWYCHYCEVGAKKIHASLTRLQTDQEAIRTEVKSLTTEIQRLQIKDQCLEKKVNDLQTEQQILSQQIQAKTNLQEGYSACNFKETVKEEIEEREDIEARKMNIIIYNLPEAENRQDDLAKVKNLFEDEFHLKINI